MTDHVTQSLLSFWFVEGTVPGFCEFRPVWFKSTREFDAAAEERFRPAFEEAVSGNLDHLAETPHGSLALVILLDQFSRNLFRDDARAFATDEKALGVAKTALARGFDRDLTPLQRIFLYLPFQHSEDLGDQHLSVRHFDSLGDEKVFHFIQDAARRHLDIIQRFGRYPHRNAVLGRVSTSEERRFLESSEGQFWTA